MVDHINITVQICSFALLFASWSTSLLSFSGPICANISKFIAITHCLHGLPNEESLNSRETFCISLSIECLWNNTQVKVNYFNRGDWISNHLSQLDWEGGNLQGLLNFKPRLCWWKSMYPLIGFMWKPVKRPDFMDFIRNTNATIPRPNTNVMIRGMVRLGNFTAVP